MRLFFHLAILYPIPTFSIGIANQDMTTAKGGGFLSRNKINKSMSVSYSWDRASRTLTETSKITGKVVAKVYDLKHDEEYSKRINYAGNGKPYNDKIY
jgi:hypothetical protein